MVRSLFTSPLAWFIVVASAHFAVFLKLFSTAFGWAESLHPARGFWVSAVDVALVVLGIPMLVFNPLLEHLPARPETRLYLGVALTSAAWGLLAATIVRRAVRRRAARGDAFAHPAQQTGGAARGR